MRGSEDVTSRKVAVSPENIATEYLANERTFLAWVRTSIAVITFGFALAKVHIWLGEMVTSSSEAPAATNGGGSIPLGVGMILFGGLLVVLAAWRYLAVNRRIKNGVEVSADRWMIVLITILVAALSLFMAVYLLNGPGRV